jgi:DNA polymerase-3 subunit alpha
MAADPRFIHLRVHTEYSLLEGAVPVKKLPGLVANMNMPAVAVTDTNDLFCALEFSESASAAGVQPIIGAQFDLAFSGSDPRNTMVSAAPIVLLAQNETGYGHMLKLMTCAYLGEGRDMPHITLDDLGEHAEGIIALTGGPKGPIGRLIEADQTGAAEELIDGLAGIFGDRLYVELQRHPTEGEAQATAGRIETATLNLAYAKALPIVATNDVYFPKTEMYEAHDALICIAEGAYVDQQGPRRRLTPQHYLKSPEEMATLFADLPEALENTVEIAKRCAFCATKREPLLPKFADDEIEELQRQAREGLAERLKVIPHAVPVKEYEDRLEFELKIIEGMGFPGYFLIVADFIKWAKDHGIPVGPGRGSGAGSLVAYALTITDLDPLRYNLLFERFLNPERVSMPDFDIDFCMVRREEVIQYVQEKYGRDRVGQIITFGALLSKAAVRDVGRVLQMPYGQVDRLSKMIPVEGVKPVSIEKALAEEPRLREEARAEEVVDRLLTYGQQLEGLLRNASTHAAGVVIGDRPLDELVPLYRDPRSDMPATQFNMKWVEQAGLVKYDFLGLKTLTVIQNALDLLADRGVEIDIGAIIPLDDPATYELYADARTVAVFQVESSGMMDALRRMKPTCVEDIIALVALYRPGPMENIPTFCEVKNGQREREFMHPSVDHILDETMGIIVYQEQVMQIAQEMAGYSLGGADLLRRAMGKKIQAEMDKERPKFLKGAADHGVDRDTAVNVWNLLDKFANYGFNKSHAAAYAVVSYQTAWLKANHPVEFMAGVMNCDLHLTDKLAVYADEVRKSSDRGGLGVEIIPPCVNRSRATFSVDDGRVVYALGALKNVGVEAMRLVVEGRGDKPFVNLFDFARRVDIKRIGKRPLEMLARAGAFDQLDQNRRRVFEALDKLTAYSAAVHEQAGSNQSSLFGDSGEDLPEPRLTEHEDWLPAERLREEFTAIGFYLSGHPLDDYMGALRRKGVQTLEQVTQIAERGTAAIVQMAGVVAGRQERKSARGNRFAFVQLSDVSGQYEVTLFSEALEKAREHLESGNRILLTVEVESEADQLRLRARSVQPIDDAVAGQVASGLQVFVEAESAAAMIASVLERARSESGARAVGPVTLTCKTGDLGEADLDLPGTYPVTPQVKGALKSLPGVVTVEEM